MSYLMTIPRIVQTLSGLYLMVHARLESHKNLLKLAGRLDLVLAQIAKAQASTESTPPLNVVIESDDGQPIPITVARSSDDEEEMEDEMERVLGDGDDDDAGFNEDEEDDDEEDDEDDGLGEDDEEEEDLDEMQ
jgi:U3 small nucleolar RNA-associated protein 5